MFYRTGKSLSEKLKIKFSTICFLFVFLVVIAGCATGSRTYREKTLPGNIIPEDAFLYIRADKSFFNNPSLKAETEKMTQEYGIPDFFKDKTETISVVALEEGWEYIIAEGSYPDSFIKSRLQQSSGWKGFKYKKVKYFYGNGPGIILVSYKNNCLITANSDSKNAEYRAEKIIDILKSDRNEVYIADSSPALHMSARKKGNSLGIFLPGSFSVENVELMEFDLFPDPENRNKTDITGSVTLANEKMAVVFSSVIRLFLTDYYRKEGIADLKTMLEKNSITYEGRKVFISITDIPMENLGTLMKSMRVKSKLER